MLPTLMQEMSSFHMNDLVKELSANPDAFKAASAAAAAQDEDVPDLVGNFDDASKNENI